MALPRDVSAKISYYKSVVLYVRNAERGSDRGDDADF